MQLPPIRRLAAALILCLALLAGPARAAVEISFYSRELGGNNFPHAFFALKGTVDSTGEQVDTSLGFTASSVTPAILFGPVRGEVQVEGERQIARSDRKFAIVLTDEQYRAVMAVVEEWRNAPQPSYRLRQHSCVHFVSAVAAAIGLQVDNSQRLMNRPRSFLERVIELNPQLAGTATQALAPAAPAAAPPPAETPVPTP
ncbi:MAG TPA: hypothetical protein VMG08_17510 [Allosphingosinicella sp.]|nr:hypothetical protein [Allosphingosinicella sp.]